MRKYLLLCPLLLTALCAAPSTCPQFYVNGEAPEILNEKMTAKTRELCNESYVVMHSGITKTALWSAQLLTREGIDADVPRKDVFQADNRLSHKERSELSDYARSGYDRGHLTPSADAPTESAQAETFLLSNIIPQDSSNNRNLWSNIESATRYLAKKEGSLYVITGPIFKGELKAIGKNNVFVPTMIYKIIYSQKQQKAAAYLTENASGNTYKAISVKELEVLMGINFFPKMSDEKKAQILALPEPKSRKR